jgi:hypothetical protein
MRRIDRNFLQRRANEFIANAFYRVESMRAKFMQEKIWHRNFLIAFLRVRIGIDRTEYFIRLTYTTENCA